MEGRLNFSAICPFKFLKVNSRKAIAGVTIGLLWFCKNLNSVRALSFCKIFLHFFMIFEVKLE